MAGRNKKASRDTCEGRRFRISGTELFRQYSLVWMDMGVDLERSFGLSLGHRVVIKQG